MRTHTAGPSFTCKIVLTLLAGVGSSAAFGQGGEPNSVPGVGRGWVAAEGGGMGGCDGWTEEYFGWMVERAWGVAGGRKVRAVVLASIPLDEPDERLAVLEKLGAEAIGMVVGEGDANSDEVAKSLAAADLIFIRGGDQSRYVNWWKGTATEAAIRAVFERGGVVGGTSAGCAILGEVSFDARVGSLSSDEALTDARHRNITLTHGFLGLVPGVMFDSHFGERSRLARGAVMLAHANEGPRADDPLAQSVRDPAKEPIELMGVDPCTAVMVSPTGERTIMGRGRVTTLSYTPETTATLKAGEPPMVGPLAFSVHTHIVPSAFVGRRRGGMAASVSTLATTWNRSGADELDRFLVAGGAEGDVRVIGLGLAGASIKGSKLMLTGATEPRTAAVVLDVTVALGTAGQPHGGGRLWVVPVPGMLDLSEKSASDARDDPQPK